MFEANSVKKISFAILAVAGALLSAAPARADTVTYTLTTVNPTVAPGGTVTFNTSIVAPSTNAADIYIVSDASSCTACTVDDTDFGNTPFFLAPGQSYAGPLFTVTTMRPSAGVNDGTFDITFSNAADTAIFIDSDPFHITVASSTSVTPEPASWLLLGTGLAVAWLLRRRFFARVATV